MTAGIPERSVHEQDAPATPVRGALELSLPQFEGPLDLLLHLVRSQGIDILDIPIVEVTEQYNAYLDAMQRLDLEIASEYLVMAATLAHIKSKMLLPADPLDEDEDPRRELVEQLIEHEKYRQAADALGAIDASRELFFVRCGGPPQELSGEMTLEVDLSQLVQAFERVLDRLEQEDVNQVIRREDFSVPEMMERITEALAAGCRLSFSELLERCRNRLERVVLFLGLLELVRLGTVAAEQSDLRGDIAVAPAPRSRAADSRDGEPGGGTAES